MKNILVLLILIFSFVLSAKIVKVEGEYTYTYSDDETIVQAKKKCLDFAKRDALEKFATYISSESVYKNYMTEKDQVVARSLGVLKNVVINEENIDRANSTIFYKVSAEVDEEEVLKKLEKKQEKNTLNVKIKDFVRSGINAEKQLRIGDALKYYYWSLLLVKSDSKSSGLKCEDLDDRLLTVALPEKINSMLTSLEMNIKEVSESRKYKNIDFEMKYQGSSVRNLVLTYFDGDVWSRPVKVRDGVGNIELFGDAAESITKLSLRTGYKYEEQCNYDHNVKEALKKVGHIPFSAAKFKVRIPKSNKQTDELAIMKKAEEERLRKEREVAELAARRKAKADRLRKEKEAAELAAKKTPVRKEESMLDQHYKNQKNDIPLDPSIRRKEVVLYGIFAGANGDFGDNEILGESGFASSGYGAGLSTGFPIGQSGFYFLTDFSFIYHAVDADMFEEWYYNNYLYDYDELEVGSWFNMPMMVGGSYRNIINPKLSVYGNVLLGVNIVKGPDYYYNWYDFGAGSYYYVDTYSESVFSSSAFSIGFGITYNKLDVSFKYLNLGEAEMTYINASDEEFELYHKISMMVMTIGVKL